MPHRRCLPLAALLPCLLFSALAARADDNGAAVDASLCRSYPRRQAELEKWLNRTMIPGQTTPDEIVAIFGSGYYHPFHGFDRNNHVRYDTCAFIYNLEELGIHDRAPKAEVLYLYFDERSGRFDEAEIRQEERQTGFHLEQATGQ